MSDQNSYNFYLHKDQNANSMIYNNSQSSSGHHENPNCYNNNYLSLSDTTFADYKALSSGAFDLSFNPLSEAVCLVPSYSSVKEEEEEEEEEFLSAAAVAEGNSNETTRTPISSTVSAEACSEAGFEEETSNTNTNTDLMASDQCENQHQNSNKVNNTSGKKGEKKARGARFAFMTKSEVDHLEDGYRWRKYGQKAVKNSSFPRSYYRCTSQKCNVKKRVERCNEDPSFVMTTYEGQHNHHTPSILRGNAAELCYRPNFDPKWPLQPPHDYTLFHQP